MIGSSGAQRALVEITGVAGTGKSTVTSLLVGDSLKRAPFISARDPGQVSLFLMALPRIAPLVVRGMTRSPRMTWADFKLMVYVTSWDRYLRNRPAPHGLVFDQGPLYALVRLRAKGLGVASSPAFGEWWSGMLAKWLEKISLVIWLDAADDTLMERISRRDQGHLLKDAAADAGSAFLARYRSLFDEIASAIEANGGPEVVRIDTTALRVEEVAKAVAEAVSRHEPAT